MAPVVVRHQPQSGAALTLARRGRRPRRRSGALARLRAALAKARHLRSAGDYPAAPSRLRSAITEAEVLYGPRAPELVPAPNELGMTSKYRGDFDEAQQAYQHALSIQERHGATDTDDTAAILHNLGGLAHACGESSASRVGRSAREKLVGT